MASQILKVKDVEGSITSIAHRTTSGGIKNLATFFTNNFTLQPSKLKIDELLLLPAKDIDRQDNRIIQPPPDRFRQMSLVKL